MPPLPPIKDVFEALQAMMFPAAGAAALVFALVLILGRWAAAMGSALAIVAGIAVGNLYREAPMPWVTDVPSWHQLPRAALLLVVVGLLSRWFSLLAARSVVDRPWLLHLVVWLPRSAALVFVAFQVIPETMRTDSPWVILAFVLASLLEWLIFDTLARDGNGGQVAAYQSLIFLLGSGVMLYAHSGRFMDIATIVGCAFFGVAVVAGATKVDASGSVPAGIGFLPGLMLSGRFSTDSQVPLLSFWLVALAPMLLAPWLVPVIAHRNGWAVRIIRVVLILGALGVALVLAGQKETLPWEEQTW